MHIKFVDQENQAVIAFDRSIVVLIPSPLTSGDGKCRIAFAGGVAIVTPSEARRVADLLLLTAN